MGSNDECCSEVAEGGGVSLWKIAVVASIASGVMFGGAILSMVVPYVQHLGVPHAWSSFIWICGPISGMLVQPIVGYSSDRVGRRKPYIIIGVTFICISVLIIAYALEVGVALGDSVDKPTKPRGIALFLLGFGILDVANNVVQDPTRAFLADLSKHDHKRMSSANALFSFFMAIGNIMGYVASSYANLHKLLPFTRSQVCDVFCANLKACFFLHVVFLICVSTFALLMVPEPKLKRTPERQHQHVSLLSQLRSAFANLEKPMWVLYLVTGLNWIAWFPFLLFNTDWVGKEVYGGDVKGGAHAKAMYDAGVREGLWGLLLTAVSASFMSLLVDPLSKALRGPTKLWGSFNFVLAAALFATVLITKAAKHARHLMPLASLPSSNLRKTTLCLFAIIGIPQAVTLSVPFALATIYSSNSGAGHGLSLGMLNFSIVIPQMLVSATSGFWDYLFGGGNLPAFVLGSVSAALSGILALNLLPSPMSNTI